MLKEVLTVSALIAVVLLVRAIFKNRVPKRMIYCLWLVVLLKLCLPGTLVSLPVLPAEEATAPVQRVEAPAQTAPVQQPAQPVQQPAQPVQSGYEQIMSELLGLKQAVQAGNMMQTQQPAQPQTAEDIIANIIAPKPRKETK